MIRRDAKFVVFQLAHSAIHKTSRHDLPSVVICRLVYARKFHHVLKCWSVAGIDPVVIIEYGVFV